MTNPVFLVDAGTLHLDSTRVAIEGDEGRHAATVRRLRLGETVDVCDGAGLRATGRISDVARTSVTVDVDSVIQEEPDAVTLIVVQAIAKGDRAEMAIEMATELGAAVIVPWQAQHSVATWTPGKSLDRWRRSVREAAKQSRRAFVPEVRDVHDTASVCTLLKSCDVALGLHEAATVHLADIQLPAQGSVAIVVGPEGGVSAQEVDLMAAAGARVVRMGSHVLRTSTAAAAALAALSIQTPAWGAKIQP